MTGSGVRAVVVTVGEELLSGATVDGNAAWLGRALAGLGIPVDHRLTVGDRDDDIVRAVRTSLDRAPVVLVTGGLGPTADDRTRPAVARALGVDLVEDPLLVERLRERLRAAGRGAPTPGLRRLALRPTAGRALPNPAGAAPGLVFDAGSPDAPGRVVLLPGVPREMRALFPAVAQELRAVFGDRLRPVVNRVIHTTGIPESELAPRVDRALADAAAEVEVAFLPDLTGVDLRLTTAVEPPGDEGARERAAARLDGAEAALASVLDGVRFEAASGDLVETVAGLLEGRGWWLATAESCTGGLLAQRWTARAGASRTFRGGVVAYANEVKEGWLGVPAAVLEAQGAVSEAVAVAMATGACQALDAECGVGITGVAGPGGGTPDKPVGTVWIAVSVPGPGGGRRTEAFRGQYPGDREAVRVMAAQAALHRLFRMLAAPSEEAGS